MTESNHEEIPVVFPCEGETLVGIVHRPAVPASIGVVTIIAGGPQYRAGVGRGMVSAARDLAAAGIPVLRFDHRGLGDGGGTFLGFEHIAEDIQAAVDAFRQTIPEVSKVVLWGGCDSASAAMIHGWKIPEAASLVVGNPWIYTAHTQAIVIRKHYLSRLQEWSFWRKLLRFEYNVWDYIAGAGRRVAGKLGQWSKVGNRAGAVDDRGDSGTFVDRMLDGLGRFNGPVLFLISGQSMLSREFDELLNSDAEWHRVCHRSTTTRIDFPDADQTFSDASSRQAANRAICAWLTKLSAR
jgi:exosortase A-associated hydrolase 1